MFIARAPGFGVARVVLGLAVGLVGTASVLGAVPPVLDRVPADSFAVVAVEDLTRLDDNSAQLMAAIEMEAMSTFSQALGAMGLRDGLNMKGSAAGVLYPPAEGATEPELLLVVPIADYPALLKNLRAQREGDVDRFEYAKASYFAREIGGGFAVAGRNRSLVELFVGEPGQMNFHLSAIGERGRQIASGADVVMLSDMKETRRLLKAVLGPAMQGAPGMGVPLEQLGGDPRASVIGTILERVESEGKRGVVGLTGGPLGLRMDLATEFREGTFMRRASEGGAKEGQPFAGLGKQEYLFLGSMNFTHPGLRALVKDATERVGANGENRDAGLMRGVLGVVQGMDSASIGVYAPPSLFVGLLSRGVIAWESDDPSAGVEAFRSWLGSIDGREVTGATLGTSFQPGAQRVAGVDAASWSIGAKQGSLGQQMLVLYGSPSGPQGLVGVSGRRGYLTWSKDPAPFENGVRAGAGEAEPVSDDLMLQQVRALLPGPRAIEWYINARPVLSQVALIAGQKAELPELLPPIGAGVVMSDGSLHTTIFLPAPMIKSSFAIMERVGGAFGR